jgi:branched-chain amino acid transport system permease protein
MTVWSSKAAAFLFILLLLASPAGAGDLTRSFGYGLQQAVNASLIACLYSLLAVAYALIHGITGRIILSFGDMAMFAAFYGVYAALLGLITGYPAALALLGAFAAAAFGTAALGHAAQRHVFGPLLRSPSQAVMIASVGLSIILQEVMRVQSSGREQWLPPFGRAVILDIDFDGFSVRMTELQGVTLAGAVVLLGGLWFALTRTHVGRLWRACVQNRALAELCGIDVGRVTAVTAIAGAAFAAAAGWIIAASYGGVSFYMGLVLGLKALFASILGGFGTVGGAIAGGVALAALETAWTAFFPIIYRDVAVFLIIVLVLVLRPEGLLGVALRRDSEG